MRQLLRAIKWGVITKIYRPVSHRFPTAYIHTNNPWTIANWPLLHRGVDDEAAIKRAIALLRPHTLVTHDGLLATYRIARHTAHMEGAFVETGVYKGGAAALMAMAARHAGFTPTLHLFDSFEGLPSVAAIDDDQMQTGAMSVPQREAERAVFDVANYPRSSVVFHVGWFSDTVPASDTGPISLLRLDGDLYESTLVCLRSLYPRVMPGGFVIIDDYNLRGCRAACEEFFREIGIAPFLHYIDGIGRYFVKAEHQS